VKVRCSRCKHIFYVVPPPETKEEIIEDAESFAKYHEELIESGEKKREPLPEVKAEEEKVVPGEEEAFPLSEKAPEIKVEEGPPVEEKKPLPVEPFIEAKAEIKPSPLKETILRGKRRFPRFLILLIILALLVLGILSLWKELGSGGRFFPYIEPPVKKTTELWNKIWGIELRGLIVGDLSGYEERVGETTLFIIEGKVRNQSRYIKKHIKIRVVIFDQDKLKIDEEEAICGRIIGREELRKQSIDFFQEGRMIKPQTGEEMTVPPDKATPFMVIFRDLPSQAKEFKVEIVEAPNL
jgi:hypothetical protein